MSQNKHKYLLNWHFTLKCVFDLGGRYGPWFCKILCYYINEHLCYIRSYKIFVCFGLPLEKDKVGTYVGSLEKDKVGTYVG